MEPFNPTHQVFNITAGDGITQISVQTDQVNQDFKEAVSVCISYGSQLGASLMMFIVVLAMKPAMKLLKPNTLVQTLALLTSTLRMLILSLYFPSQWTEFYATYSGDFSHIPRHDYLISVCGNTMSLILVILVELALIMQAWTMVSLWSECWKWVAAGFSALLCLATIGFRLAFCVMQNQAILTLTYAYDVVWVASWSIILGAFSICWFCALFNVQLVVHLVSNRRFLPLTASLAPMEVLIMTNGVLMVIPVVFASLEWSNMRNFESASLTYTTAAIILPLGTLIAHRLTLADRKSPNSYYQRAADSTPVSALSSRHLGRNIVPTNTVTSRVESGCEKDRSSHLDVELAKIDGPSGSHYVRVDHEIEQHAEMRVREVV